MHRALFAALLVVCGCNDDAHVDRAPDTAPMQQEQLAALIGSQLDAALGERLVEIETSLEQIQLRLELLVEELKTAQVQQDRLATFESEIKQALLDLGNVLRRALSSQRSSADGQRDLTDRRP